MEPVYDVAALLRRNPLVHHHLPMVFHIASVTADHAVKTDIPQFFADLSAAPPRANVHAMPLFSRFTDSSNGRSRDTVFIGHQCAIHVQKNDFSHMMTPPYSFL